MLKNQLPKFSEMITALAELYDKQMSAPLIDLYWAALRDYPLEKVQEAVVNIIRTHKYANMPKPAEFIEFISPPADLDAQAFEAENHLIDALAGGDWESFEFRDPVIALVVAQMGGWISVCDRFPRYADQLEDQKWWLKDFRDRYKAIARRPLPPSIPRMIGRHEHGNHAKGYLTNGRGNPVPLLVDGRRVIGADGRPAWIMLGTPEAQAYIEYQEKRQLEAPDKPAEIEAPVDSRELPF